MKTTAYLISCLLLCAAATAGYCSDKAGTSAGVFLKLPTDVRSAGMGEAYGAGGSGSMALFSNPAGLAGLPGASAGFSHALLVEDLTYDVLGAAVPLKKAGVLGVGVQRLAYGSMDSRDKNDLPSGTLSPSDAAYLLGWGINLDKDIALGAAGKYIDSKISGSASTLAADLGVLISGEDLSVGFAVQNLGKGLKFNTVTSPLPVNYRLGFSIPYKGNWEWTADINFPNDGAAWAAAGAEYAMDLRDWALSLRAGYNTQALDTKGINGFSAGFGIERKRLSFDYAFRAMGVLGSTHHLGFSYRWGGFSGKSGQRPAALPKDGIKSLM